MNVNNHNLYFIHSICRDELSSLSHLYSPDILTGELNLPHQDNISSAHRLWLNDRTAGGFIFYTGRQQPSGASEVLPDEIKVFDC